MTHEKNMIDYLDCIEGIYPAPATTLNEIWKKKHFLKSQPMLGDFVATNEDGEVMEKPNILKGVIMGSGVSQYDLDQSDMYIKGLENVMWKGWEVDKGGWLINGSMSIYCADGFWVIIDYKEKIKEELKNPTYEQLINSGVKLERIEKK